MHKYSTALRPIEFLVFLHRIYFEYTSRIIDVSINGAVQKTHKYTSKYVQQIRHQRIICILWVLYTYIYSEHVHTRTRSKEDYIQNSMFWKSDSRPPITVPQYSIYNIHRYGQHFYVCFIVTCCQINVLQIVNAAKTGH